MAKKKSAKKSAKKSPGGRIVLRTGEALVEADEAWSAAEPEVVIGELDGPVGYAIANLMGNQVKGHTKVFAILNSDVQVRPATVMVSKVTVNSEKYTNILMGTVQAAIAHGVLDAVRRRRHSQEQGERPGHHRLGLARPERDRGRDRSQGSVPHAIAKRRPRRSTRRCTTSHRSTGC